MVTKAQQAEVVSEATSLLDRVENLMQESEKTAAATRLEKNWPAATRVREVAIAASSDRLSTSHRQADLFWFGFDLARP